MDIVEELRALNCPRVTDYEHDVTAAEAAGAVSGLLAEIILKDETECDKLGAWVDAIRKLQCETLKEGHNWVYDQCGFWGHKHCVGCMSSKYPEIPGSHSEGRLFVGDMTEDEYLTSKGKD